MRKEARESESRLQFSKAASSCVIRAREPEEGPVPASVGCPDMKVRGGKQLSEGKDGRKTAALIQRVAVFLY